ncbi:prephenate dehydratase [Ornithinimicrobium pekingense]|uniref:Prephenate dehydratase n=1 Tax=Ornithinimicrobium pekingense TaxID=384677 RepID=A0ABQ2FEU3_9MICO|nr:prephenate dehydratase [Ornithinimicrobium pekingense]GGK80581.1 prephenate dehydratase [Ornithinimicrobium pekingense]
MTRIAYLGPAGTFTEQATQQWAPEHAADAWPAPSVPAAIAALREGRVDAAVVPFENSVEGSVPATLQALLEGGDDDGVRITAEVHVEVQFSLLVRPGTQLEDVSTVASHPHAFAQTRDWLTTHLPTAQQVPEASTARAAQAVGEGLYDAAVAAPGAADAYGLVPAVEHVADREGAVTRFVVLRAAHEVPAPTGSDRTTLVALIWQNKPGALLELLEQFATRGIDLSRLESRPTGGGLGEYCFWIDADAHLAEARMREALTGLRRTCRGVRFLGSYPRADGRPAAVPAHADDEAYAEAQRWVETLTGG